MTLESGTPYPQCKIVPLRLLGPDTTERLLNNILEAGGIRRVLLNGHNIPLIIQYFKLPVSTHNLCIRIVRNRIVDFLMLTLFIGVL